MSSVKQLIIYYHNHHLQMQHMDMATCVLEQMSLTVTTPHPTLIHSPSTCLSLHCYLNLIHPLLLMPYICFTEVTCVPHHQFSHVFACAMLSHPHSFKFAFAFTCTLTIISRLAAFAHLRSHASDIHVPHHWLSHVFVCATLSPVFTHTSITSTLSLLWLCALTLKDVGFWWCDRGYSCCCC
jgi:hypothetical protein